MKNTVFTFLAIILIFSCGKDDETMEPVDPCAGIVCNNGGQCLNGVCDCPDNYEGPSCDTPIQPSKISITKVTVKSFPPVQDNGTAWDTFDGADLFFRVEKENGDLVYQSLTIENAVYDQDNIFAPADLFFIDVTQSYNIFFYDQDTFTDNDFVMGTSIVPLPAPGAWPPERLLEAGDVHVVFDMHYEF